jgi:hypothetical protein
VSRLLSVDARPRVSPGFGVSVSDAVQASCSAFSFFDRKKVKTDKGDLIELIDGGYTHSDCGGGS